MMPKHITHNFKTIKNHRKMPLMNRNEKHIKVKI